MATNNNNIGFTGTTGETLMIFNDPKLGDQYASFNPASMEDKKRLYNAINSPDRRVADFINTNINLRDVVICKVKLSEKVDVNSANWTEETDRGREGFRVILIDDQGESYTATSAGIYNSVCTLRTVFGTLHFDEPMGVTIKQIKTKNGNTLTLSLTD